MARIMSFAKSLKTVSLRPSALFCMDASWTLCAPRQPVPHLDHPLSELPPLTSCRMLAGYKRMARYLRIACITVPVLVRLCPATVPLHRSKRTAATC